METHGLQRGQRTSLRRRHGRLRRKQDGLRARRDDTRHRRTCRQQIGVPLKYRSRNRLRGWSLRLKRLRRSGGRERSQRKIRLRLKGLRPKRLRVGSLRGKRLRRKNRRKVRLRLKGLRPKGLRASRLRLNRLRRKRRRQKLHGGMRRQQKQVVPLLRYLDRKVTKYADLRQPKSYVELVRMRTCTKVRTSKLLARLDEYIKDLRLKNEALRGHIALSRKLQKVVDQTRDEKFEAAKKEFAKEQAELADDLDSE
ncbi:hypothetical protein AXG93_4526s1000 [Marchantia polymorpha subsp. ruderalis]|uniref:Uncharacterized protein n=1 Tax=Marchantia polymorpha subsp. ruderalis TaxID=1480154 RepID=A0A176VSA9_MARPO|nr:hypothetical protein AXG93_4526s1000 [Marchantia polymorpha subsp. ruderalis]